MMRIKMMTAKGAVEYLWYTDNRELAKDYLEGKIAAKEVVYKDMLCEVSGDFEDEDGERYLQLNVLMSVMGLPVSVCQ